MSWRNGLAYTLRLLLGVLFVVSAIAKLFDIDQFEIYIFSFGLTPLGVSFVAARLVIVAELLLGIGLAANVYNRFFNIAAILTLACFSIFLCYALLAGRHDSCHCMGSLLEMNPALSLLKNAILVLWVLSATRSRSWNWQPRWPLMFATAATALVTIFIISPPDNWMYANDDTAYNRKALRDALHDGTLASNGKTEVKAMVFLTPGCPYCHMTDKKIDAIMHRHHIKSDAIQYYIPTGGTVSKVDSTTFSHPALKIGKELFMLITYSQRPLMLLLGDDTVAMHYRSIDEKRIVETLTH